MPAAMMCRLLPLLLVSAAGCSGISIHSSHDPDVDFAQLHTFDWLAAPPDAKTAVNETVLLGLLQSELEKKGLVRSTSQPDVLVAVQRSVEGNLNTKGWGYEVVNGRLDRYPLQEGMLVIDLIAAKSRNSVWRSTASGAFRFDSLPEERRAFLTDLFQDMFADFPARR